MSTAPVVARADDSSSEEEELPGAIGIAPLIRAIGVGPGRARSLTRAEACGAFAEILGGTALPEQVGAFLMLLRYRGESPAEIAGMRDAARAHLGIGDGPAFADIDLPSHASGRLSTSPLALVVAALLARSGLRVMVHAAQHSPERRAAFEATAASLGLPIIRRFVEAQSAIWSVGAAFAWIEDAAPRIAELLALRSALGLRSPVHTLAKLLNPANAPAMVQGVFHPAYCALHCDAAALWEQRRFMVFKGGGGEALRNPYKQVRALMLADGEAREVDLPAVLSGAAPQRLQPAPAERVIDSWRGRSDDEEIAALIVGTAAVALLATGQAATADEADARARALWQSRGGPASRARA